ncbi:MULTISPECIES: HAD family hydrolase [Fischerella]|uniref:HAD family hydrolase n=1 Tax=Fischerella muscicola CCMEE 5323 TaxID=2019572 RepID=A0A2N6K024_FISMU|nr:MULTISPECIES: HAD family hydrolase [Fischerella]MBD2432035.1 HAD family hydrolase [Fischerella sp. FACHB-380]PLZ87174.1 HAD family hydrolase [Fischerella muscicola CCMEE 5323]
MVLQAVLLDIDGTLVLSNDAHAQTWVDTFREFGYDVSFEQVRSLIGMGGDQIIPRIVPGLTDEEGDGKAIAQQRRKLFLNEYAPKLVPANGARQLVQHMLQSGLRLIVASSASSQEMEVLLKVAQVDDLLTEKTTSSDAEASKPAPDIVEAALGKLNSSPQEVLMLGDTPYDIKSASQAGVGVIAVRCGGFDDAALAGAKAIYDDPADLLVHYADSPLGKIA